MKKTITLAGLLLLVINSLPSYGQIILGFKAGLSGNSAGYKIQNPGEEAEADEVEKKNREIIKWKPGYTIGVAAEYGFSDALSLQTGLELSRKGYRIKGEKTETEGSSSITSSSKGKSAVSYLEIPVNLAYKTNSFQLHAGPYIGVGLAGKGKFENKATVISPWLMERYETKWEGEYVFKNKISEADNNHVRSREDFVRRLDAGLNLGVGYPLGPVMLSATYSKGFSNLQPTYEGDEVDDNRVKYTNKRFCLAATWFWGIK